MMNPYNYDRTARIKTAMPGSLWSSIGLVFKDFTEKLAYDLLGHIPAGWKVKYVHGGAMNQVSSSARFENAQGDEVSLTLYLGKDLHVEGFAALSIGPRQDMKSNLKIKFDSFSSPEVVARSVGADLTKLFAADATFTRLI
jgi:hypothetical protein